MVTAYGKRISILLFQLGMTREWLARRVEDETGRCLSAAELNAMLNGEKWNHEIISIINKTVGIE